MKKISTFLFYTMQQVRFFIKGFFDLRFLTARANCEIKKLKERNKVFHELQYSKIHKLLDLLHNRAFVCIAIGLLISSIYITQALVLSGVLRPLTESNFLTDFIAIQGTFLFALAAFFPIAVLLQGVTFKDNSIKDEIMQVMKRETRVFELIVSSILLLCYMLFLRYANQIKLLPDANEAINIKNEVLNGNFNAGLASIILCWFFVNIYGFYNLIYRGFCLLKPLARNASLVRYVANEAYPLELASLLRVNIYYMLCNMQQNEEKGYISFSMSESARKEVEIELLHLIKMKQIFLLLFFRG